MRYLLMIFVLAAFIIYPNILTDGVDAWVVLGCVLTVSFQIVSGIWLYKDIVGWDKFEYSEGLRLKRKKTDNK